MASLRKRSVDGEVRYDVPVTRRGAPRLTKTFPTKALAERWARDTEYDIERGAWRSTDVAERMTVADLMQRYSESVLIGTRSPKHWHRVAMKVARSELGKLPLIALGRDRVAEYRDHRLKSPATTGGPNPRKLPRLLSPTTVRAEVDLLRRAIDHAMDKWRLHLTAGNPATISLPKCPRPGTAKRKAMRWIACWRKPIAAAPRHWATQSSLQWNPHSRAVNCVGYSGGDVDLTRRIARIRTTKSGKP